MTPESRTVEPEETYIAGQLHSKHIPAATNMQAAIEQLTVSMQRRGDHASITIKDLLGNCVFCWGRPEAI
jgi:hypothetical protein